MTATLAPLSIVEPKASPAGCPICAGVDVEVTDIFCGAGGSSLGLELVRCPACGRSLMKVTQALNHWDLAVEAHNANFPDADHDVHDVEVIPANRFRRTDVLWASPECVHHAYCRGKKADDPSAERSRATMHDVVRFTAHHRYDAIIVENVIEARLWEPFDEWRASIEALGYDSEIVFFNSQFALPTPQSRDRMYVVFWRKGLPAPPLSFRPTSWCSACSTVVAGVQTWKPASKGSLRTHPGKFEWGRYGAQYRYTCPNCHSTVAPAVTGARTIIDWTIEAQRIGDRAKPLAVKTRERIKRGLERLATTEPVTVQVGGHLYERPGYARVWSVNDPLRAVTGTSCMGVAIPEAALIRAGGQEGNKGHSVDVPFPTITAHDRQMAVVIPNRENAGGAPVDEPMKTVTTAPVQQMLVQVNRGGNRGGLRSRDVDEPTPTIAGHGELAIVSMRNHGRAEHGELPAPTVCGGGLHHGLLVYNGNPGFVRPIDDAAGTVTGRDKQSLLVPYYGTGVAHGVDEPCGTLTGKVRHSLVVSDEDIDDCLFRMLQWPELLRAQQMHELPDGTPYQLTAKRRGKDGKIRELSNEKRVKMIGNAVSSPVATMLGHAVLESLLGRRLAEAA